MEDGKETKIAYADPHYAESVLKTIDQFSPCLIRRAADRTEKKNKRERKRLSNVNRID